MIDADIDGPLASRRRSTAPCPHLGSSPRHPAGRPHDLPRRHADASGRPTGASRSSGSGSGRCSPARSRGFVADALNRLAAQAPHLYVDRDRYWFDRQQNVNRTARDEADAAAGRRPARGPRRDRAAAAGRARRRRLPRGCTSPRVDQRRRRRRRRWPAWSSSAPTTRTSPRPSESPALVPARGDPRPAGHQPRAVPQHARVRRLRPAAARRARAGRRRATSPGRRSASGSTSSTSTPTRPRQARNRRTPVRRRRRAAAGRGLQVRARPPAGRPRRRRHASTRSRLDQQGTVAAAGEPQAGRRTARLRTQFPPVLLRHASSTRARLAVGRRPRRRSATLWDDFAKYVYLPRLRDQDVLLATVAGRPRVHGLADRGLRRRGRARRGDRPLPRPGHRVASRAASPTALVVRPAEALAQLRRADEQPTAGARYAMTAPAIGAGRHRRTGHRRWSASADPAPPTATVSGAR